MRVVIVGKTNMAHGICVGALIEETAQAVRLIPKGEFCNPRDTPFEVGDVWDLSIKPRAGTTPPHVEDHDILKAGKKVDEIADLGAWLRKNVSPWKGGRDVLFEGTLKFRSNGKAYVPEEGPLPSGSTGFWILPAKMTYAPSTWEGKVRPQYALHADPQLLIKYVGLTPTPQLPAALTAGTLVRLSLAHTFPADPNKLFLQLSGWYR